MTGLSDRSRHRILTERASRKGGYLISIRSEKGGDFHSKKHHIVGI